MEISIQFLRKVSFFASLEESELEHVFSKLEKIELKEDTYLFQEGDLGNALYILVQGKLVATTQKKTVEQKIGYIWPGEVVGDLSMFSNAPRSASIKSVFPSVLLKLTKENFQSICFKYPNILWEISTLIATRSQSTIAMVRSGKRLKSQIVVLITLGNGMSHTLLLEELQKQTPKKYPIQFLNIEMLDQQISRPKVEQEHTDVYIVNAKDLNKFIKVIQLSDKIIFCIHPEHNKGADLKKMWDELIPPSLHSVDKELLLVHDTYQTSYSNTQFFKNFSPFARCYHVTFSAIETIHRWMRFLVGKAIGLVLSGGGAKGWALIGAMKAVYELNIPIDYIGGTSSGALIACSYALSETYEQFYQIVNTTPSNPFALKAITYPLVSILNSKEETLAIQKAAKGIKIEDLSRPFFCISANLSSYVEHIWDTGFLWQACRASSSVAPLWPPITYLNEIHIDGGIMNNFPVDVMEGKLEQQGYIIGIDISSSELDSHKYDFPPIITFLDAIKLKMKKNRSFPSISQIMDRMMMAASIEKVIFNRKKCDLLIHPQLQNYRFSDFSRKEEMFTIGYEEAKAKLTDWMVNSRPEIF